MHEPEEVGPPSDAGEINEGSMPGSAQVSSLAVHAGAAIDGAGDAGPEAPATATQSTHHATPSSPSAAETATGVVSARPRIRSGPNLPPRVPAGSFPTTEDEAVLAYLISVAARVQAFQERHSSDDGRPGVDDHPSSDGYDAACAIAELVDDVGFDFGADDDDDDGDGDAEADASDDATDPPPVTTSAASTPPDDVLFSRRSSSAGASELSYDSSSSSVFFARGARRRESSRVAALRMLHASKRPFVVRLALESEDTVGDVLILLAALNRGVYSTSVRGRRTADEAGSGVGDSLDRTVATASRWLLAAVTLSLSRGSGLTEAQQSAAMKVRSGFRDSTTLACFDTVMGLEGLLRASGAPLPSIDAHRRLRGLRGCANLEAVRSAQEATGMSGEAAGAALVEYAESMKQLIVTGDGIFRAVADHGLVGIDESDEEASEEDGSESRIDGSHSDPSAVAVKSEDPLVRPGGSPSAAAAASHPDAVYADSTAASSIDIPETRRTLSSSTHESKSAAETDDAGYGVGLDELVSLPVGGVKVKSSFFRTVSDAMQRYGAVKLELQEPGLFPKFTGSPLSWERVAFMTTSDVAVATDTYAVLVNGRTTARQYAVELCAAIIDDLSHQEAGTTPDGSKITEKAFREAIKKRLGFVPWKRLCSMLGFSSPGDVEFPAFLLEVTQASATAFGWTGTGASREISSRGSPPHEAESTAAADGLTAVATSRSSSGVAKAAATGGDTIASLAIPQPPRPRRGSGGSMSVGLELEDSSLEPLPASVLSVLSSLAGRMRDALPGSPTASVLSDVVACRGISRDDEVAQQAFLAVRKPAIVSIVCSLPDQLGWVLATLPHLETKVSRRVAPWLLTAACLSGQTVAEHHRVAGAYIMSGPWLTSEQRVGLASLLNQEQPTAVLEQAVDMARASSDGAVDVEELAAGVDADTDDKRQRARRRGNGEDVLSSMIGIVSQYGSPALLRQVLSLSGIPPAKQASILARHTVAIETLILQGQAVMRQLALSQLPEADAGAAGSPTASTSTQSTEMQGSATVDDMPPGTRVARLGSKRDGRTGTVERVEEPLVYVRWDDKPDIAKLGGILPTKLQVLSLPQIVAETEGPAPPATVAPAYSEAGRHLLRSHIKRAVHAADSPIQLVSIGLGIAQYLGADQYAAAMRHSTEVVPEDIEGTDRGARVATTRRRTTLSRFVAEFCNDFAETDGVWVWAKGSPGPGETTAAAGGSGAGDSGYPGATLSRRERSRRYLYKAQLCKHWAESGNCPFTTRCRFAHGEDELRMFRGLCVTSEGSKSPRPNTGLAIVAGSQPTAESSVAGVEDAGHASQKRSPSSGNGTTGEVKAGEDGGEPEVGSPGDSPTSTHDAGHPIVKPAQRPPLSVEAHGAAGAPGLVDSQFSYVLGEGVLFEEDVTHEFKRSLVLDELVKYIIAFLNTRGGTLYCGIEDNGVVCGLHIDRESRDQTRLALDRVLRESIKPAVIGSLVTLTFVPVVGAGADHFVVEIKVAVPSREDMLNRAFVTKTGSVLYYRRQASVETIDTFAGLLDWYDHQRAQAAEWKREKEKTLEQQMREISETVTKLAHDTPRIAFAMGSSARRERKRMVGFGSTGMSSMDGETVEVAVMGGIGGGRSFAPPLSLGVGMDVSGKNASAAAAASGGAGSRASALLRGHTKSQRKEPEGPLTQRPPSTSKWVEVRVKFSNVRVGMRGTVGPCDFHVALQQVYGSDGCRVMLVVDDITPGGQLFLDGRVRVGAHVLKINGKTIVGQHGERIAKLVSSCKDMLFRTPSAPKPARVLAAPAPEPIVESGAGSSTSASGLAAKGGAAGQAGETGGFLGRLFGSRK